MFVNKGSLKCETKSTFQIHPVSVRRSPKANPCFLYPHYSGETAVRETRLKVAAEQISAVNS